MTSQPNTAAVLFDLDGTLLDSALDFHAIVNALLQENNHPSVSYDYLKSEVSEGARAMLCRAFQLPAHDSQIDALLIELLARYQIQACDHATLFTGMDTLLSQLESTNTPWGIVTNKPRRFSEIILDKLNLTNRCATLICPEDVTHTKPHPEALLLACQQARSAPDKSIYIGDHIRDIEAGNRANMFTIGALYGYIRENEDTDLWNASRLVTEVNQLWPLIKQHVSLATIK